MNGMNKYLAVKMVVILTCPTLVWSDGIIIEGDLNVTGSVTAVSASFGDTTQNNLVVEDRAAINGRLDVAGRAKFMDTVWIAPSGDLDMGAYVEHWEGLTLWLPMNEGEGPVVFDRSGGTNHGAINGPVWNLTEANESVLEFDGVDDGVSTANRVWDGNSPLTVLMWIKTSSTNSAGYIICQGSGLGGSQHNFGMLISATLGTFQLSYRNAVNGYGSLSLGSAGHFLNDGTWHHIAGLWNPDENYMSIWANGEFVQTHPIGGSPTIAGTFYIGRSAQSFAEHFLDFSAGRLKVYSRALSGVEVKHIYDSERHLYP